MDAIYDTDLTDRQFKVVEPFIPMKATKRGRKPVLTHRQMINAVLYVNKHGCTWRGLPKEFGPWKTVYHRFNAWSASGDWQRIHDALVGLVRVAKGRNAEPTVGIVDSQSVKTTQKKGLAVTTPARRSRDASGISLPTLLA